MARTGGSTTLWRYVAYTRGGAFELEPISAETAAEALNIAKDALDQSDFRGRAVTAETFVRIGCSTSGCLAFAATDRAGRYLCDACASWFSPGLF